MGRAVLDRAPCRARKMAQKGRTGTLDVIGAGFGRTGTASLKGALELLGLAPCYHMFEVSRNPGHVDLWLKATDGRLGDWEEVFAGYRAAVDWPASAFYAALMARYPDARVILTVRDPNAWYASAMATIYDPARTSEMGRRIIWDGVFDGRFADREHALAVYRRHADEVRRRVPPERLLVYDVREGWEPLCRFLALDPPAAPFLPA